MKKEVLRKNYKQKRKELTKEAFEMLQQKIYDKVYNYDFSKVTNIHIFLPIVKQLEINTYPIIDFLISQHKNIIVSKSNFKNNTLTHHLLEKDTELIINAYGIPEPNNAKQVNPFEIDLVFVPLLISDKLNYRVGYGKGFYDRFLADCRENIQTIGLNLFTPIDSIEDINEFDIPLNEVFHP